MGLFDNFFKRGDPGPEEIPHPRAVEHPRPVPPPMGRPTAQPRIGQVGPLTAPDLDLPVVPTWTNRLWGTHSASLTSSGTRFVLENSPQRDARDWSDERTDTLGVHLVEAEPWLSWRGHLIGKMNRRDREDAVSGLQFIDQSAWRVQLPGRVSWYAEANYVYREDGSMEERPGDAVPDVTYSQPQWVSHNGRRDLTWYAHNAAPAGNVALLPSGGALTVKLDERAHATLQRYIRHGADVAVYTTLDMAPAETPRSGPVCRVSVDGVVVGRLTPQSARRMAPAIENLAERGYETATWSVLSGNTVAAELSVYPQRSHEIDEAWLIMPDSPQPGPNG